MKIFLIGMMGSGKSYWAERLGRKLQLPRFDLDQLIEDVEDRTISRIFEESGEDHFRKMESIVLKWFADRDAYILSTGGGTPCFHGNMEWMNNEGRTIWLDEDIATLAERLEKEKAHRPLIASLNQHQLQEYLAGKRQERHSFYAAAQHIVSGKDITESKLLSLLNQ